MAGTPKYPLVDRLKEEGVNRFPRNDAGHIFFHSLARDYYSFRQSTESKDFRRMGRPGWKRRKISCRVAGASISSFKVLSSSTYYTGIVISAFKYSYKVVRRSFFRAKTHSLGNTERISECPYLYSVLRRYNTAPSKQLYIWAGIKSENPLERPICIESFYYVLTFAPMAIFRQSHLWQ